MVILLRFILVVRLVAGTEEHLESHHLSKLGDITHHAFLDADTRGS
jgi:hypothetical protein